MFAKGRLKRIDREAIPPHGGFLTTKMAPREPGTEVVVLPEPFWTRAGVDAVYRADLPLDTWPAMFVALQQAFTWEGERATSVLRVATWWERLTAFLRGS
jgi:hypothetical protein